jgi:hypothetical protein
MMLIFIDLGVILCKYNDNKEAKNNLKISFYVYYFNSNESA